MSSFHVVPAMVVALICCQVSAAPQGDRKAPPDPDKLFARKDADKNGTLTLEEFKTGMKEEMVAKAPQRFKKLDTDGDGKLSLTEFKANFKPKS